MFTPVKLEVVTGPAAEPVTLAEAKNFLRVDIAADDGDVGRLVAAGRKYVEDLVGRALVTQTLAAYLDGFPADAIVLPRPPLQSVASITYTDLAGAQQTLDPGVYAVDAKADPGRVVLAPGKSWPATLGVPNAVKVTFTAGQGDAAAVDPRCKQAILLLAAHWYANRELAAAAAPADLVRAVNTLVGHVWHGVLA